MSKSFFSALLVSTLVLGGKSWKVQKHERIEQPDTLLRELTGAERDDLAERLPDELLRRITGREDAVELLRVSDRILRVMEGRGTILDVVDLSDRAIRMLESN